MTKAQMIAQLETLRTAYAKIERIDPAGAAYGKLVALLDSMDDELLIIVKDAQIKFMSMLALNRCIRRGLV
jgi:hypothetical protein